MKPQFVTAFYLGLEGTRYCGNSFGIYPRYLNSFKSLADGGYEIICYTSAELHEELRRYFSAHPNVTFIVEDLSENYFHNDIERIKDLDDKYISSEDWRSRCVQIMWGKFFWLWKHISRLEENDSLFWIDAGIFHGGLITNNLRSEASKNPYDFDRITQLRDLHADLSRFAGDRIINIRSEQVNHGYDDFTSIYGMIPDCGVNAGIFGGKRDKLLEYISQMVTQMQLVVDHNKLLKEEEIMYYLYQRHPEQFADFYFRTWYSEDWNIVYDDGPRVSFSDFFRRISE